MKETIRWHLSIPLTYNPRTLGEIKRDDKGEYVLYLDHKEEVEQLQARIKELESAERTLNNLGYRNLGGELWKPPLGKKPDFNIIDSLNERIKELESQSHINEIKAQGIEEAIKQVTMACMYDEDPVIVLTRFGNYAEQLRTKHD